MRTAYPGTHEPSGFGERDSGNVLLVEVAEAGAKPEVRALSIGSLCWETRDIRLMERGQLAQLRRQIESTPVSRPTLLEIRLSGLLFADETAEIVRLEEILSSRFLYGRVDTSALAPAPADGDWVSSLPQGFLRNASAKLSEIANSETDRKRRLVAAHALRELYALKQGGPA